MKKVTAQSFDTFVRPDTSDQSMLNQRQRQVASAFQALGVNVRQSVEQETKREIKQKRHELKLQADAVSAKMKLALSDIAQDQHRNSTPEALDGLESMVIAKEALGEIDDVHTREELAQRFSQSKDEVLQRHKFARQREDNITNYGAVVADMLQTEYTPEDVNKVINKYKTTLGDDTLPSIARIALATEEIPAIDAILARDDLHPQTIAQLEAGRSRIVAANERALKQNKAQFHYDRDIANAEPDRAKRIDMLSQVINKHGPVMSDAQMGSMLADIEIAQVELKEQAFIEGELGSIPTSILSQNSRLPVSEIKEMHDRKFMEAVVNNDKATLRKLVSNPTDIPQAAKDYFGNYISALGRANPDNPSEDLMAKYERTLDLEKTLGATTMKTIMGDEDYAKFQMVQGIAAQETLPVAISRLQDYNTAIANGRPPVPERFPEMKREVVSDVVSELEDKDWSPFDYDIHKTDVEHALRPYFKVWGAMGLTEGEMTKNAKRILGNSTWGGLVNGNVIAQAFNSLNTGSDGGEVYDKSSDELFKFAVDKVVEDIYAAQGGKEEMGDIAYKVVPHAQDHIQFYSEEGVTVVGGIVKVDYLTNIIRSNMLTEKEQVIADKEEQDILDKLNPGARRRRTER